MEKEFTLIREAYTVMHFLEVRPTIDADGNINYPRKSDYIQAWINIVEDAIAIGYLNFGVYYSGMSEVQTGNWVLLPDNYQPGSSSNSVSFVNLTLLLNLTYSLGF